MHVCIRVCMYACMHVYSILGAGDSWQSMYMYVYVCMYVCMMSQFLASTGTAILILIECQFQVFQRFPSSKLVLKTVESCFNS
jgi:hypothetical protein